MKNPHGFFDDENWSVSCTYWGNSEDWTELELSEHEARGLFASQAASARSARVDELELRDGNGDVVAHWYYDEEADKW